MVEGAMRKRVRAGLALLAVALAGAACRGEPSPTVVAPPNPTTAPTSVLPLCAGHPATPVPPPAQGNGGDYSIVQPGVLLVGSVPGTPPFETMQGQQAVGFDIDLIAQAAHRLGLQPVIEGETPSTVLADVAHGKTDVAISALSIQPASTALVDFTDPYFRADLALTVGVQAGRGFPGVAALAGTVVGVAAGSDGQACAQALAAQPGKAFTVRPYADISQAFTDLSVGRIQAVLTDLPTSQRLVQAITGLQMVAIYRTGNAYGIAVSKANPNLRSALNRLLADFRQDGTYKLIYEKWFQVPPPSP